MPIERQVIIVYAATKGYLDKLKVSDISAYETSLQQEIEPNLLTAIREQKAISDELNSQLKKFFDGFTDRFIATRA